MSELDHLPVLAELNTGAAQPLDLDYFFKHDYADVGEAATDLPAIIEYVNEQRQILREQLVTQKQRVKRVEASTYFALKEGLFQELHSTEKMTETAIGHAMQLEVAVTEAYGQLAILTASVERLTTTIMALQLKLDMVRSTEATRRRLITDEAED